MLVLGLVLDGDLRRAEALFLHFGSSQSAAWEAERVDAGLNCSKVGACVDEGTKRHVAADSARAVEVCNTHGC
jgi:hypothetical protein